MGLSQQALRDIILKGTGTDIGDWENGNTDLDLYLNRSWWQVMDEFDFREKESAPLTFQTVAGTREYDLSSVITPDEFESIQRVAIVDPETGQHTDLVLLSDFDYENLYVDDSISEDDQAKPTRYFRRGANIYLYQTPDDVYDIVVYCLITLADLASGSPPIPQSWHEIIGLGGLWRALIDLREFQNSDYIQNKQASLISGKTPVKAKEVTDSKMAGVEVPGRDY
jgi:hypothetical protein